jgi:hypothetical protein
VDTAVGDSRDKGMSDSATREPLLRTVSGLRLERTSRRQRRNNEPVLRDTQNLHDAACRELRKRNDAVCARHKSLQKDVGIETELSIAVELERNEIVNGHHIATSRTHRAHIGIGCMKNLAVHASKAALSVQQVAHVSSPAASRWQAQLLHAEFFSLGRQQHSSHVASIAAIGPRPSQGRDVDRNSDLVSPLPI